MFRIFSAPHIGHLYSSVIADAIFRFEKLLGNHTTYNFSTGTDEHGSKIQQAAQKNNTSTQQYCDLISKEYKILFDDFRVGYTDIIRTSEKRHRDAVETFWVKITTDTFFINELRFFFKMKLYSSGTIYKANYSGWYCVPDETFLTDSQLKEENGNKYSIESGHPVEWSEEENYLFQLSKYRDELIRWIDNELVSILTR